MNKVKCKETGQELRDGVWVYQGTDKDGRLCIASDGEMEHHPDPIGWNIYVPEEKVKNIKAIVQEWLDKQGHERCWYYPDLFSMLALELGIKPTNEPALPSREEFECGCKKYQDEQFKHEG